MAHEYGWAKNDILENVYLEELFVLTRLINRRKLVDYKMQLAIVSNPTTKDPKRLWTMLDQRERENDGKGYLDAEFDTAGFEALKSVLKQGGSKIIVK